MSLVVNPYSYFTDTNGNALNGYLYVGEVGKNAENYPIAIFYDNLFTTPAPNPLTVSAGYIYNSGTIAQIYASVDYSIIVKKTDGSLVYSSLNETGMTNGAIANIDEMKDFVAPYDNYALNVLGYSKAGDGGGGVFYYDANSTEDDNGGTIIEPTSGSGRWIRQYSGAVNVKWFGASSDGTNATATTTAIQNAINSFDNVYLEEGEYATDASIVVSSDNLSIFGDGFNSKIVYKGASKINSVLEFTSANGYAIIVKDISIQSTVTSGATNSKWGIKAARFSRGSILHNLEITGSLGVLCVEVSYHATYTNLYMHRTATVASNWTLSEWQEVYGAGKGAICLLGGGSAVKLDKLTIERIGTEQHSGNICNAIIYNTTVASFNNVVIETCGIDYDGYSCELKNIIYLYKSVTNISNLAVEAVGFTTSFFSSINKSKLLLSNSYFYDLYGTSSSSVIYNDSLLSPEITYCKFSNISSQYMCKEGSSYSGNSTPFIANNNHCITGWSETDAAISGDDSNVTDTYYRTVNKLGLPDNVTSIIQYKIFPKRIYGLTATVSSDTAGNYLKVVGGILNSTKEIILSNKNIIPAASTTDKIAKIRVTNASKYYRLYLGILGNMYLVERTTAFTEDSGDWLYQFQTDSSALIINLSENYRLTKTGSIDEGRARFVSGSIPTTNIWVPGDICYNSTPSAGGTVGWVCITSGTPGTWKGFGTISA